MSREGPGTTERIVAHSESVAGTASGPAIGFVEGVIFVIIGSHEWLACLRFAVLVMISPRLEAADDALDHREDELNVDDRRFGLS
jgi:hypothetical protein